MGVYYTRLMDDSVAILHSKDSREQCPYEVTVKGEDKRTRVQATRGIITQAEYDAWTPPKPVETTKRQPSKRGGKK